MTAEEDRRLEVRTTTERRGPLVRLRGELDLRSAPALRAQLLELLAQHPQRLIVDLAGVGYMDSSGVGTLVELKRRLERGGGKLVLTGLQPRVRSLLEITRLDQFFTLADSLAEARKE